MQDHNPDSDAAPIEWHPPGAVLRAARERRGATLEAIAAETRIPLATLRSIESGSDDGLPAAVFVRGFVRNYARAVGLDPAEILRLYEREHGPSRPPKTSRWPGIFRMRRRSRLGVIVAFFVSVAVIAALLLFVYR